MFHLRKRREADPGRRKPAGVYLNGIFAPLNTGLVQISRSHFKQSKNSMLKTRIYVIRCFVNFLVIFGYIWVKIVILKGLERFREIRKIEDLMKFKNENLKLIINRRTPS